ncbi:CocE/NonD family hydrolase [Mycobacterium sherrisii]|uniref:CocE/NonD family hydrolase n=1 Tax=Mycobacterium sherrisii TaxID=243061 RepID=UPI002DDD249B|nr:CocE/NonD family hydrolase [Mycobacterium sherrisii]MEC4761785.1 CocE/NonD family hydrolase [Mycobacterium sherrisii]
MSMTSTRPGEPALRTLGQFGGNALGRVLGLRPATTGYTVNRVEVPMRDGARLVADHYAPTTSSPAGTVLVRGPYGRGFPFSLLFARLYASRGYHVVMQSVRGTFGSTGQFEPMVHEGDDGADTVAWLINQPWFTGRFATLGPSYLGFTQWAILQNPPPQLAAAVITAGPHDFAASVWDTGSFAAGDFLGWSDMVAHQEDPVRLKSGLRQLRAPHRVARTVAEVPFGAAARRMLGSGAPWFESWVENTDPELPFWERLRFGASLDRVEVPVLLLGGWQDIFLRQTVRQYRHLRGRGVDVAMTIGPWTHTQLLTKGLSTGVRESLDWLDTHLAGISTLRRPSRVRVCVTGQGWRNLPDWPPVTTQRALYLWPGRHLHDAPPDGAGLAPVTFRYDPANPTPTIGGALLAPVGGYRDDSRLARRDDVLTFDTATLLDDLCVYGNPAIELQHSSDNPNVDVFVRVSEVDAKGRSRNVSDAYRRLGTPAELVRIELDPVAHRFRAGSRIRVLITGSWSPRYAPNLGTDEPPLTARQAKPATHAIAYGRSRLLLPVGPAELSANGGADPGGHPG